MTMIAHNHTATPTIIHDPNDVIEAMTGRRHLSWSQLTSYRGCPKRWVYSHIEGLRPEFVGSALVLGSAFHSAAQHHYEQRLIGQSPGLEQLCEVFQHAWQEQAEDAEVRYGKNDDEQSAKATGIRMIETFMKSELATPADDVIAIEETLSGSIHPDMPDLLARVDVMWQADNGVHLCDLKTSRSRWSASKVDDSAEQLLLYQTLASHLVPDQPLHLSFGVITKGVSPAVQKLDVPLLTAERGKAVVDLMLPVWDAMKAGVDFASPSPMSCATCGYQSRCPAYRG